MPPTPPPVCRLANLHASCLAALATQRMPTTRNEEYRFTDVSALLQQALVAPAGAAAGAAAAAAAARPLKAAAAATVVLVDGVIDEQASSLAGLPKGVYAGGLAGAPADVVSFALVSWSGSVRVACGVVQEQGTVLQAAVSAQGWPHTRADLSPRSALLPAPAGCPVARSRRPLCHPEWRSRWRRAGGARAGQPDHARAHPCALPVKRRRQRGGRQRTCSCAPPAGCP